MRFALRTIVLSSLLTAFQSGTVAAQQSLQEERLLLPGITTEGRTIAGAFGAVWQSYVTVIVRSGRNVSIRGYYIHRFGCVLPCGYDTPPDTTFVPGWRPDPAIPDGSAQFLWVDKRFVDDVTVTVRIQDLSRQSLTWGTAVPVVREADFSTRERQLLDIPTEDRFRWTLRIYEPQGRPDAMVRVRFYETNPKLYSAADQILDSNDPQLSRPDALVHEQSLPLVPYGGTTEKRFGYAQLSSEAVPDAVRRAKRLRISVVPASDDLRVWGFVSIVNNETQHVTISAPSVR